MNSFWEIKNYFKKIYIKKSEIASNVGWLFVDKIIRLLIGVIVIVWMARYLGRKQFGELSYATAFVSIFSAIAGMGLQNVVIQELVLEEKQNNQIIGTALLIGVIGGLLAYGIMILSMLFILDKEGVVQHMIIILGGILLIKFNEVASYWFESKIRSKYIVLVQTPLFILFAVTKIYLVMKAASIIVIAWIMLMEAAVSGAAVLILYFTVEKNIRKIKISKSRAIALLKKSMPLLIAGVANSVYMKIDQIMLGRLADVASVGIYSAAVKVSEIIHFLPAIIISSIFPIILKIKEKDIFEYNKKMQQVYDLMVWLSILIALPITMFSNLIISILYGAEFVEAGMVLSIHIWTSMFVFLGIASNNWYIAENKSILTLQRTVLGFFINIVGNIFLIPQYGAVGAALGTLISQISASWLFDYMQKETRPVFYAKLRALQLASTLKVLRTTIKC